MKEIWKDIPGYEGRYQVSNKGRARSLNYANTGKIRVLKEHPDKDGYPLTAIKSANLRVHKLVMLAFAGPCPDGLQVNHINGIKNDNRLENLEYVTPSRNTKHSYDNELQVGMKGEVNPLSKLKKADVIRIRQLCKDSVPQRRIGEMFGISQQNVSKINTKEIWGHIS